ncbi:MAG: RagB/SusD family nutrient uptake outer membrane protein [Bacteroidales bacterium]|nr:RagB/SusD family nutrient uptake outer membrane protein [Bacteroidales bacterium]
MKNILKFLVFIFVTLLPGSCSKDNLDPVPKTSISDLTAFDTKDRIVGQVNGLYDRMKNGQYRGGRFLIYNDIRANDFDNMLANGVTGYQTWQNNVTESTNEVNGLWSAVYAAVNGINVFIEGLDASRLDPVKAAAITEAEYQQYKGEALTLRALCYFDLLQLYAKPFNMGAGANLGVPLRLKANKSSADNDLARSTVAEVYTQILADLNAAEPTVALTNGTAILNTTRVHRNTVIALKTRVLLHMNNFSAVVTEGNKIVPATAPFTATSGVANALEADIATVFSSPWITNESVLSMPMVATDAPGTQNGLGYYYSPAANTNPEYSLITTGILNNAEWVAGDTRRNLLTTSSGKTWLNKFRVALFIDYVPVIRYSEVLLNLAEAESRAAGSVTARSIELLNAVRGRANGGTYVAGDFADLTAFLDKIMLERNIEFLGEGIRNMDIMRTVSTVPGKSSINPVPSTSPNYIWSIPLAEVLANKLIVQQL